MRHNPFKVVEMFEETMADYCGSKYAIATDNCTDALMIAAKYLEVDTVTYQRALTYLSLNRLCMLVALLSFGTMNGVVFINWSLIICGMLPRD